MANIEYIEQNFTTAQQRLRRRGFELPEEVVGLGSRRRELIREINGQRERCNILSGSIGQAMRNGQSGSHEIDVLKEEVKERKATISTDEAEQQEIQGRLDTIMLGVPNFPAEHAPDGKSDADNVVRKQWGRKPEFDFALKDHVTLGNSLDILDFDRAARISGSRFVILKGAGSILQRSLISFMLDLHRTKDYREVTVPYLVSREAMTGTGQLPKFEFDLFKTEVGGKELFLIPTAEVPVTNLHAQEILSEDQLPIRYACYSESYRAEAGSAGRDTRGMLRQHQFPKIELVHLTKPEDSWQELETLRINAEDVLQQLGLHYQVVSLCTADLGFSASYTYDLEVWIPGQQKYREISSCSNCEDFQARRMNSRFKRENTGKKEFIHTLNGSGVAVGRSIIAILEQCQRQDGSVVIPEALQPYTRFKVIHPGGKTS
jgi:seryl-tRNA synthetase